MKTIELTHANTKQKVYLVPSLIFCYYYSEAHKATLVMASGGAMLPVSETTEQIARVIDETQV